MTYDIAWPAPELQLHPNTKETSQKRSRVAATPWSRQLAKTPRHLCPAGRLPKTGSPASGRGAPSGTGAPAPRCCCAHHYLHPLSSTPSSCQLPLRFPRRGLFRSHWFSLRARPFRLPVYKHCNQRTNMHAFGWLSMSRKTSRLFVNEWAREVTLRPAVANLHRINTS